jgi:hypothetical protein
VLSQKIPECKVKKNKCKFQINMELFNYQKLIFAETAKCQALSMGIKGK